MSRGYARANAAFRLAQRKQLRQQQAALERVMALEASGVPRLEASAQAMHEATGAPLETCRAKFDEWLALYNRGKAAKPAEGTPAPATPPEPA